MNVASIGVIVAIGGLIVILIFALYSQMRIINELFNENFTLRSSLDARAAFEEELLTQSVNRLKFDEKCVYDIQRRVELIEKKLNDGNKCNCSEKKLDVYNPRKGE